MTGRWRSGIAAVLLTSAVLVAPAWADETITYTYDARGRLVQVSRSGTVNSGVSASYTYDKADNRTNVTVSGAASTPDLTINDISVTEGGTLVFTVTRGGSTAGAVGASWATSNGTAVQPGDYTAGSGSVSFAAGETSKTVSVTTIDDTAVESAEALNVTLSVPTGGATISDTTGVGTINDNDTAAPSFAVSDVSVAEGGTLSYTVTKTGTTSSSFSVNWATSNGTGTAGSDYTAGTGTLTFLAAETSKTVSVVTIDDTTVESSETVNLNLSGATGGATISDNLGIGTINDNDTGPPPSFSINDSSGTEGPGATITFTVARAGTSTGSYSVNFATANGTASSTADYFSQSGTLTFASGETSKTIIVSLRNGTVVESTETLLVNLSAPSGGATISDSQGVGTIYDDDSGGGDPCPLCRTSGSGSEGGTTSEPPPEGGGGGL